jgi:glutamate dehydrogenase (NAD(P)+)
VRIHKLVQTDAFVVFDLEEAPRSLGITRLAPKILVDGAELLARSSTYLLASFEQQAGGASGGINARPDGRDDAVAGFVAEMKPLVEAGTFTTEPGRGLTAEDLAPLTQAAPAPLPEGRRRELLVSAGVVAAATRALGGLDGRRVVIEGWDQAPRELAAALTGRGASVVGVTAAGGALVAPAGLDPAALATPGADLASLAAGEPEPTAAALGAEADLVLAGSKTGVIDHDVAASISAAALVPWGPVPVTAKALAVLRRGGTVVVPDFLAVAGPALVAVGAVSGGDAAAADAVAALVTGVLDEVWTHDQGPVLGACHRAEAYLRTWRDSLPFGRPLA